MPRDLADIITTEHEESMWTDICAECEHPVLWREFAERVALGYHQQKIADLKGAVEFYDKVSNATEDEKIAVGTDHHDRLMEAVRNLIT